MPDCHRSAVKLLHRGCSTSSPWWFINHHCLHHLHAPRYLADYCVPVSEVLDRQSTICQTSSTVCSVMFAAARLEAALFLSLDQQSGIYCQMICEIQLFTPNIFGGYWKHLFTGHEALISALRVFYVIELYKSTFTSFLPSFISSLLTYLLLWSEGLL